MATFTNQATLTYNGGTASSNITTGELLEVLTATKTAVVPTYRSGRPITYLITLVNAGTADLTGLTVADDLGGYTFNGATVYRRLRAVLPERRFAGGSRRHRRSASDHHRYHRARRRQHRHRL